MGRRHLTRYMFCVTTLVLLAVLGTAAAKDFEYPEVRVSVAGGTGVATQAPGGQQAGAPSLQTLQTATPTPQPLVSGLNELQGSTVGPDGALYVTATLSGEIWRIDPESGETSLFASGLPARNADPFHVGSGVVDLVFLGDTAYALVTSVDVEYGAEDYVKGVYRIDGPDTHTVIANIGTWSEAHLPTAEFFIDSGFQYAIEAYGDGFLVTDAHHNRLLSVGLDGEISEVFVLENVVPTGMSIAGEAVYLALAGPIPHEPQNGKVLVLDHGAPPATEIAAGARLVVDVEFIEADTLLALSQGEWEGEFDGEPALPNTGSLVQTDGNGAFQVLVAGLDRPTSLEIIADTGYIVTLGGEVWVVEGLAN